jgi:hypothetical protein
MSTLFYWVPMKPLPPRKQAFLQLKAKRFDRGPKNKHDSRGPFRDAHGNARFITRHFDARMKAKYGNI